MCVENLRVIVKIRIKMVAYKILTELQGELVFERHDLLYQLF